MGRRRRAGAKAEINSAGELLVSGKPQIRGAVPAPEIIRRIPINLSGSIAVTHSKDGDKTDLPADQITGPAGQGDGTSQPGSLENLPRPSPVT